MDTLTLNRDDIIREAPTGILTHNPPRSEPGCGQVWPEASGHETPTYLHPVVIITAASGYAWFLLVFWVVFFGYGYMGISMTVATLISGTMLGLMAAGGTGGRNGAPWQRPWRSLGEFLGGEVEVCGARVSGWDAFVQLVGMAWLLAALATVFGVIIEIVRP
jgi:hypothetical protein